MKRYGGRTKAAVLVSAVCFLLLLGLLLPVSATGVIPSSFRYGSATLQNNKTVSGGELLSMLYGITPSAAERAYLNSRAEFTLTYNDTIPDSIVTTYHDGEAGTLDVSLSAYSYSAENGALVTWIPQRATLGEQLRSFENEGERYFCRFEDVFHSEDYNVEIAFSWTVTLPEEGAHTLLGAAYAAGSDALDEILAYEGELADYRIRKAAYDTWQAHLQSVADFDQYLADCEEYDDLKREHDAYLLAYGEFSTQLGYYQAWRDYYDYIAAVGANWDAYVEKRNAYQTYQAQVDQVVATLDVLESNFRRDSHLWQLYGSLMGDTVAQVVARRDELVAAGCDAKHINAAGASTTELRKLMKGYADLRAANYPSEHARYTVLYHYYTQNYTALKDNYAKLYGALIALYDNYLVVDQLRQEGKLLHFQQFVGQLYVIATALDDTQSRSASWTISKKPLEQVVEKVHLIADTDKADPSKSGIAMPAVEVEKVEIFEKPMDPPTCPYVERKPKEPDYVDEPTIPTPVDPPADPAPPEAEDPGAAPTAPVMSDTLRALANEVREGTLKQRQASAPRSLTFEKTMGCTVSIRNLMGVTFYGYDETGELKELYRTEVEYGTAVTYNGPSTKREETPANRYKFLGWIESDGSSANLDRVTRKLSLYANYEVERKQYPVTWTVDGVSVTSYHYYGDTPKYPDPLTKPSTNRYTYEFSGWDRELSPVTGATSYTGSFCAVPILYTVTWEIDGECELQSYEYGQMPVYGGTTPEQAPDSYRYVFTGWKSLDNHAISAVSGNVTYVAQFQKIALATAKDGSVLPVLVTDDAVTVRPDGASVVFAEALKLALETDRTLILQWEGISLCLGADAQRELNGSVCKRIELQQSVTDEGTRCTLRYVTSTGKDAPLSVTGLLMPTPANEDGSFARPHLKEGENWIAVPESGTPVTGGFEALVRRGYRLQASSTPNCDTQILPDYVQEGERVSLKLTCVWGYEVSSATVLLADGTAVPVTDLSFIMPRGDVTVTLTVTKIVYRVTFSVGGEIYHTAEYELGDTVLLPETPTMPSDGVYSYEFESWSPTVLTLAAGENRNPVYAAHFSKTALAAEDPYKQAGNSNRLFTVYLPVAAGVILLAVGGWIFLRRRAAVRPLPTAEAVPCTAEVEETEAPTTPVESSEGEADGDTSQ